MSITNMKTRSVAGLLSVILVLFSSISCTNDDDFDGTALLPSAIVTIKNDESGRPFFQLNDSTVLAPVNMKTHPYGGKEVRAFVNYSDPVPADGNGSLWGNEYQKVRVNWIDSIRTKKPVMDLGSGNAAAYGENDPVEIVNSWETNVEDGYITLRFRTTWGVGKAHTVNLLLGSDPTDPYKVVFRHSANGDANHKTADGIVAFRLSDLPDTEGKTVTLTLEWNSFSGLKTAKFKYRSRD